MSREQLPSSAQPVAPAQKNPSKRRIVWPSLCSALLALFVVLAAYLLYSSGTQHEKQTDRIESAMTLLQQSRQELVHLQTEFDALRAQAAIEEGVRKGLESTLQDTQQQLQRANEQLAFYDQLMPSGPSGVVSLRAAEVAWQDGQLQYRVLLQRNAQQAGTFVGRLEFEASGVQNGEAVKNRVLTTTGWSDSDEEQSPDTLGLEFDRFQRSAGLLYIPEGFEPQSVTLKVFEGNVLRLSRQFAVQAKHEP